MSDTRAPSKKSLLPVGHLVAFRYRIASVIGEGAQGVVYLAERVKEGDNIALKVIHRHLSGSEQVKKRFQREAMILQRLDGEHLVKLLDFFEEDGLLMIALEYVEGTSLEARLKEQSPLDIKEAVEIALQICAALGYAHAAGIVHRDLKPANVLLEHPSPEPVSSPSGLVAPRSRPAREVTGAARATDVRVRVVDFGVAKAIHGGQIAATTNLTEQGMIFGTAEYMAPEQARGDEADARSDLYAAGVILYEMAVGKVPFQGPSQIVVMTQHLRERPVPPRIARPGGGITASIEAVILRALEKNPADRYPTARAFAEAIASARDEQRIVAGPPLSAASSDDPADLGSSDTDLHVAAPSMSFGSATTLPAQVVPEGLREEVRRVQEAEKAKVLAKAPVKAPATATVKVPVRQPLSPPNRSRWIWATIAIIAATIGVLVGAIMGTR